MATVSRWNGYFGGSDSLVWTLIISDLVDQPARRVIGSVLSEHHQKQNHHDFGWVTLFRLVYASMYTLTCTIFDCTPWKA